MDLYREFILDHYKHPRNVGELSPCDGKNDRANAVCGDKLSIFVNWEEREGEHVVTDMKWNGVGCAISQASASILSELVIGKSVAEILAFDRKTVEEYIGTPLTPARTKCAILALDALQKALVPID